jgi:hypothetical protein
LLKRLQARREIPMSIQKEFICEPKFGHGNTKLGKNSLVWAWCLPAGSPAMGGTRPGASAICLENMSDGQPRCYAMREAYRIFDPQAKIERYEINYRWPEGKFAPREGRRAAFARYLMAGDQKVLSRTSVNLVPA